MNKLLVILFVLLLSTIGKAQLVVNTPTTATNAVQNVLLGPGVTATNITFVGTNKQIGIFNGTASNIGLANGIVIASGDVTLAVGPNNNVGQGSSEVYNNGDVDLTSISGQTMHDAAVLEFDFIPTGDSIEFRYVFASEEYNEYVCSSFNDAFGFFLSGPGITGPFSSPGAFPGGSQNIALIPGTTTYVTINTVNNGTSGTFGTPGGCPSGGLGNSIYFVDNDNPPGNTVQFDGFTVVLTAKAAVQCGQNHHIKLAVADAFDDAYDSGVFIEAGSFKSNQVKLNSNIDISNGDSVLYEGCGVANLVFSKSDTLGTQTVKFSISGTATNGVDYPFVPDSIVFQPGQDTAVVSISGLVDGTAEGLEKVTIIFIQLICGKADTQMVTFYIADFDSLVMIPNDTTILCPGDSVPIWFDISGPPYTIQWQQGGGTVDTIVVKPFASTYYLATITDTCGVYIKTDSVLVTIPNYLLELNMPNDTIKVCPQENFTLFADVGNSSSPPFTYLWSNASNSSSISVSPAATTNYTVTVTDFCGNTITDSVKITVIPNTPIDIITSNDTAVCLDQPITLSVIANGGVLPYTYSWSNGGSSNSITVNPKKSEKYTVTVTDLCGFYNSETINVSISTITSDFSFEYLGGFLVQFYDESKSGAVKWNWNFNNEGTSILKDPKFEFINYSDKYVTLLVENAYGCVDSVTKLIVPPMGVYLPNTFTPGRDLINDKFYITGYGIKELTYSIFDRWGELIFEAEDISIGWDGTYKGEKCQAGVYVCKVWAKGYNNEYYEKLHKVTILK